MNLALVTLTFAGAIGATALSADESSSCSSSRTLLVSHVEKQDIVDTAVAAGSFKTLAAALQAAELVEALKGDGPFTVFAPTDDAFAKLPRETVEELLKPENKATLQAILTFHVVPGRVAARDVMKTPFASTLNGQRVGFVIDEGVVSVQGAEIVKTDIDCTNGFIHVIDTVIMPSSEDIIETAVKAGSFKTLAAALKAAGLVEALQGDGPFTVFAPTDEAFDKLPEAALAELLKPENSARLAQVLKFHVVPGRVYSDAAAKGAEVTTLAGGKLKTASRDGAVYVGKAKVVKADIDTTNGVIHVIDGVLMP